jgi:hypothetical protein
VPSNATKLNIKAIRDRFNGSSLEMKFDNLAEALNLRPTLRRSERWSATCKKLDQEYYHGHHQENVDKSAQRVRAHESQQPQNQQNHKNRPKHVLTSLVIETNPGLMTLLLIHGSNLELHVGASQLLQGTL